MRNLPFKSLAFLLAIGLIIAFQSCVSSTKKDEVKSLSEVYNNYFTIGAAVNPAILSNTDTVLLIKHFKSLTAENCMKPISLQPVENQWNWTRADQMIDFATRNGMKVRGHCLVWHQQTPDWFFMDGDQPASKELVLKRMKEHIFTVMNRYKGKVYSWDVVNEAVDDDSSRIFRENGTKWFQICGEDFITKAFEYAHEADPQAILFYNDYNSERPEKRERIYKMLKGLLDKGIPVQGMGLQGHWSIYEPSESELRTAIERYSSLGLQLQVTELDVSVYKWEKDNRKRMEGEKDSLTIAQQQLLDEKYEMIFRVFRDYPKIITGVTFWGLADNRTWLDHYPVPGRKNYPLLFDENLQPKSAFYKVIDF